MDKIKHKNENKPKRIDNAWVSSHEELSLTSSARRSSVTRQYTQGPQEQFPQ